jgi:multidrug resistance efflux pump
MGFNFKYNERRVGQPPTYAPGKRRLSKIYWYLVLLLLLSPFCYIGFKFLSETCFMRANGNISMYETVLRTPSGAYVRKWLVHVGDSFEKDQTLVTLWNPGLDAQIKSLTEEIETLKQKKGAFLAENSELERLAQAKADEEAYLKECKTDFNTLKELKAHCSVSIFDMAKFRYDCDLAQQQIGTLNTAMAKCAALKELQVEEVFDRVIREKEGRLKHLQVSRDELNIKAPDQGSMCKLLTEQDEYVKEGQELAQLSLKRDIRIYAHIESKFISPKLKKGEHVRILMPDNITLPGVVADSPVLAESDPTESGGFVIRKGKRMIAFRVNPNDELPEQYRISGLPVEILFY